MSNTYWGTDKQISQTGAPPYFPAAQDIELVFQACPPELLAKDSTPRILVLGMTAALVGAPWPEGSEIHAVDYDEVMIQLHWQHLAGRHCHHARWQEMPFPDDYFDLVVGDGSFISLPTLEAYGDVAREVDRVRRASAPLIARFFVQPEPRVALGELPARMDSTFAGWRAASKRLAILIAATQDDGRLHFPDIPKRIAEQWGDVDEFLVAMGQGPDEVARAKQTYAMDHHVTYPSREQVVSRLRPFFPSIEFAVPDYDIGAQCPIVRCV